MGNEKDKIQQLVDMGFTMLKEAVLEMLFEAYGTNPTGLTLLELANRVNFVGCGFLERPLRDLVYEDRVIIQERDGCSGDYEWRLTPKEYDTRREGLNKCKYCGKYTGLPTFCETKECLDAYLNDEGIPNSAVERCLKP